MARLFSVGIAAPVAVDTGTLHVENALDAVRQSAMRVACQNPCSLFCFPVPDHESGNGFRCQPEGNLSSWNCSGCERL